MAQGGACVAGRKSERKEVAEIINKTRSRRGPTSRAPGPTRARRLPPVKTKESDNEQWNTG